MKIFLGVLSILLSVIGLISQFSGNGSTNFNAKPLSLNHLIPQHKYWILNGYIDSILKYKSISKVSFDPLVMDAIILRIEEDTFYTSGTLNSNQTKKMSANILGKLEGNDNFQFFSEIMGNRVLAKDFSNQNELKMHIYTPISDIQYYELFRSEDTHPLQQGMNKLLTEKLLVGEYQSLDNNKIMTMDIENSVYGFQRYNKFKVYDYFGTSHPFQGLDVIWFESEKQKDSYYNWKFSADTLILTEMLTKNQEEFFPGKKSYRYLKLRD